MKKPKILKPKHYQLVDVITEDVLEIWDDISPVDVELIDDLNSWFDGKVESIERSDSHIIGYDKNHMAICEIRT